MEVWAGVALVAVLEMGFEREVEEAAVGDWVWRRYLPTEEAEGAGGVSLDLRTEAALPREALLMLALRALSCSGVMVLTPSCRYLKELRFLDSTFCGSCR